MLHYNVVLEPLLREPDFEGGVFLFVLWKRQTRVCDNYCSGSKLSGVQ